METITKKIEVTKVFRQTQEAQGSVIINLGGARSSKSYSLCQFFIFQKLLQTRNYKLLILRKVRHLLKLSTYEMFFEILKENERYSFENHNKSDLIYSFPETKSVVRFSGMDAISQIKSTEWTDIWMEEANEFSLSDFLFLKTRLSKGKNVRIYMSLNPEACWVKNLEGQQGIKFIHSTYHDNPFLSEEYKAILEDLKNQDETYYEIYALGEWGVMKSTIYSNYDVISQMPEDNDYNEVIWGLDFGYNTPTALLQIGLKDKELYLTEKLYATKLTNADLIEQLKQIITNKRQSIYADSSEPQRIEEIRNAGFNIFPADKSVKDGLDFCKRQKIHIDNGSINLLKEMEIYKYREDKDGNILDEPVKFKDHLVDAFRYGAYTHLHLRQESEFTKEMVGVNKGIGNIVSIGKRAESDWID